MRSILPAFGIIINYFYCPQRYAKYLKEPFKQLNGFFSGSTTKDFYTDISLYIDNYTRCAASNHIPAPCVTITCDVM